MLERGMFVSDNFLNIKDFVIKPYSPAVGGDSGALHLASMKSAPDMRYIVKSETPELACNEFMYARIAAALGLYMQEVRLFRPSKDFRYAAGIRYSPDAWMPEYEKDIAPNKSWFQDFIAFQTLYVILNEEDSQEYFVDEAARLFKLDNAASFNLGAGQAGAACTGPEHIAVERLRRSLEYTEYSKYSIILDLITEKHGDTGRKASISMFERFAQMDETLLDSALDAVGEVYSDLLSEFFSLFIESRKELCSRFLRETSLG